MKLDPLGYGIVVGCVAVLASELVLLGTSSWWPGGLSGMQIRACSRILGLAAGVIAAVARRCTGGY
jgi:hypothetical protein